MAWYRCVGGAGGSLKLRTASGRIATFSTNMVEPFKSLKSDINPVQSGTGTPSPSNPRPISGFSALNVTRTGKNLLNIDNFVQMSGYSNLSVSYADNDITISGYNAGGRFACFNVFTEIGKSYTVKYSGRTNISDCRITNSDTEPTVWISGGTTLAVNTAYTFTSVKPWYQIWVELSADNAVISELQIENGSTATDFEPYAGSKYQQYFKGLLNGTYGFVELGSLNWQKNGTNRFTSINQPDNIKAPSSQSGYAKIACPNYQTSNFTTVYSESTDKIVAINTNKAINIVDKAYDDATAFKNALSGVYLIYELATATTPTITQAEINTLISAFGADLNAIKFGTTVYGGEVDLTHEKVNVSRKIVDLSTLSWVYATSAKRWEALKADMKNYPSRSADIIFEKYETDITATAGSEGKGFISALVIYVTSNDSTTPPSGNACYPLATPTEISFEAEPIKPLVGMNNIYGDTNGDMEVKYLYRG